MAVTILLAEVKQVVQSFLMELEVDTLKKDAGELKINLVKRKRGVNEKKFLVSELMKTLKQRAVLGVVPLTELEERIDAAVKAKKGEEDGEATLAGRKRLRDEKSDLAKEELEFVKKAESEAKEIFQKRVFKDERNGHEFALLRKAAMDVFVALKVDLGMPSLVKGRLETTLANLKLRMGTLATANEHGWNVALEFLNRKEKTGDFFDEFRDDVSEAVKVVNASNANGSSKRKQGVNGVTVRHETQSGGFNGRCNSCGEFGHKAFDCRKRNSIPPPSHPIRHFQEGRERFTWRAPAPPPRVSGGPRWG